MFTPKLHITLPEGDDDRGLERERHFAPILIILDAMAKLNEWHIRRAMRRTQRGIGLPVPPVYMSKVRYKEDPPGHEDWRDCYEILKRGAGDCDNLVAWRVGELRAAGIPAQPAIKWQHIPKNMMIQLGYPAKMLPEEGVEMVHCSVQWPDGRIEDISKNLGMGGAYTSKV